MHLAYIKLSALILTFGCDEGPPKKWLLLTKFKDFIEENNLNVKD
jgi:hypothetical protein